MESNAERGQAARDLYDAQLANVLAEGVRQGNLRDVDAMRVIRHELRRRNTNKTSSIWPRSTGAQASIDHYAATGAKPPKNDSLRALHADHVWGLQAEDLHRHSSVEDWLTRLAQLRQVACVTAEENYRLQQLEKQGFWGPDKYERAGVTWAPEPAPSSPLGAANEMQWTDESEDWPKRSWDFHNPDGSAVDTLDDLEATTGMDKRALARDLLALPFGKAAPSSLLEEARQLLGEDT